jgi:hypothetical protein
MFIDLSEEYIASIFRFEGVEGVVCGPKGTHLAGGCVLSKLG